MDDLDARQVGGGSSSGSYPAPRRSPRGVRCQTRVSCFCQADLNTVAPASNPAIPTIFSSALGSCRKFWPRLFGVMACCSSRWRSFTLRLLSTAITRDWRLDDLSLSTSRLTSSLLDAHANPPPRARGPGFDPRCSPRARSGSMRSMAEGHPLAPMALSLTRTSSMIVPGSHGPSRSGIVYPGPLARSRCWLSRRPPAGHARVTSWRPSARTVTGSDRSIRIVMPSVTRVLKPGVTRSAR